MGPTKKTRPRPGPGLRDATRTTLAACQRLVRASSAPGTMHPVAIPPPRICPSKIDWCFGMAPHRCNPNPVMRAPALFPRGPPRAFRAWGRSGHGPRTWEAHPRDEPSRSSSSSRKPSWQLLGDGRLPGATVPVSVPAPSRASSRAGMVGGQGGGNRFAPLDTVPPAQPARGRVFRRGWDGRDGLRDNPLYRSVFPAVRVMVWCRTCDIRARALRRVSAV